MYKHVNTMKKNSQIVIRMSKSEIQEYQNVCNNLNSNMSLRIRKFIILDIFYSKKQKDLLQISEKNEKM